MRRTSTQPPITIPEHIDVQPAVKRTMPNGLELFLLDCSASAVVRLSLVFRAGTSWQSLPFQASSTVNMLSEGSQNMNAQQIAERLDYIGSFFEVSTDRDWSVVTFCCLSKFLAPTLDIAAEIVLRPLFPADEWTTYRDKRRQEIAVNRSKVGYVAREHFTATLFGPQHPYGTFAQPDQCDTLSTDSLRDFYRSHYSARNAFAVASGRIGDQEQRMIEDFVALLPAGEVLPQRLFPAPQQQTNLHIPFQGAVQSALRIGCMMFERLHPDFIGMQVVSTILGGYFGSRLVSNLREEKGYTYGVWSAMVNLDCAGYLGIATEVEISVREKAVEAVFAEIARLRDQQVGEQELRVVKNIMAGDVLRILDGPFGIADVTIENIQNGVDNSYTEQFVTALRAITPEQVQQLAQRYLQEDRFVTVTVG